MKLSNFQNYIDPIILERGVDYYRAGCIESLVLEGDTWIAEVAGSEMYETVAELGEDGEILDSDCDCPYDGIFCKHEVAVFYALRAQFKRGGAPAQKRKRPPAWVWPPLHSVLHNQPSTVLAAELLAFVEHSTALQERLQLRFASESDRLAWAESVLWQTANNPNNDRLRTSLDRVLWVAGDEDASPRHRAELCRAVLLTLAPVVGEWEEPEDEDDWDEDDWDEDDWDDGDELNPFLYAIERAIDLLEAPAEQLAECQEDAVWLWDAAKQCAAELERCERLGERLQLYEACVPLCRTAAIRLALTSELAAVQEREDKGWIVRLIEHIELRILEAFDTPEAARAYRESHLDNPGFRRAAVTAAMDEGRFTDALRLCPEHWLDVRYQIYEQLGDRGGQRSVAAELLVGGNDSYYEILKSLYPLEQWVIARHDILKRLPPQRDSIRLKILTTERMQPELWEICKRSTGLMLRLYPHLLPEYEGSLRAWFETQIQRNANGASSRNQYREVCRMIVHLRRACGDKPAEAVRSELLLRNVRRPAFMEELRRIAPDT